jgi:formate dehydrogenase subunit delta
MAEKIEKLVRMANQIADFFRPYDEAEAVSGIQEHIRAFWTRAMRDELLAFAATDSEGLQPRVMQAIDGLRGK